MTVITIIDCETTGLPRKGFDARVIELAVESWFVDCDNKETLIECWSSLIRPSDFEIKNSHIHGITHEHAYRFGHDLEQVLSRFYNTLQTTDVLVAHNLKFDVEMILSEFKHFPRFDTTRIPQPTDQTSSGNTIKLYCTMIEATLVLKTSKWPKLVELHKRLHSNETNPVQTHRAMDDVKLCRECYFKLTNQ